MNTFSWHFPGMSRKEREAVEAAKQHEEYMKKRRKTYVSLGFRVLRVTQFFHSLLSETKKIGSWVIYGENEEKGFIEDLDRESGTALVKFVYPTLDGTYSSPAGILILNTASAPSLPCSDVASAPASAPTDAAS